jgi:PAS domain S-box-containing protein
MNPPKGSLKTKVSKSSEIEELRSQLAEANDTLRAIREGEVDAVIVSGSRGEQVFSLMGAESIYRLIVETMKEAAFTVALDGQILYCNTQLGEFLKRPINQILGHRLSEFVDPANGSAAESLLIDAQAQPVRQRLVFVDAGGSPVAAHIAANVLNQPNELSVCVVATDLTELENSTEVIRQLRRQQEALQAANEELAASRLELDRTRALYQDLFETAPDGYIGTDGEGIIQEVNQAASRMFGRTAAELKGNPFSALLPTSEKEAYLNLMACMNAGEESLPKWELEFVPPEVPRIFWAEVTTAISPDEEGNITGLRWLIRDVTERKQAELALLQSEEKFRALFEKSPDAVFLSIPNGAVLAANPSACAMFGCTEQELCHIGQDGLFDMENPRFSAGMEERQHQRSIRGWEVTAIRKGGEKFPVEVDSTLIPGEPRRSFTIIRDITERKKAEEALRKSEQRLRLFMRDAFVGVDLAGRIQDFNPAYQQMIGYKEEELFRLTYTEITPEKWHETEAQILREQILPRGFSDVYEEEYRRKDGTIFPVEVRRYLLRNEAGEPYAIWAVVRDVTERRRADEALRESERRFRQVVEMVGGFVWEVDADGLYTYTSPAVEKILGYTPDELVGKMHFYDLFAPDVREQLKSAASAAFVARQPFQEFPNNNVSKSGKIVCLATSGVPILDEVGRLLGYRGVDTDVTDGFRAETEAQLLRTELAHFSRVATMSELAASIAHELNQPLAAILANAQAALHLIHGDAPDPKELNEILEDIVADDQRAAEIIHSMRSMLKKGVDERRLLSVNDLIKDVLSIVRSECLARRVSIILDLSSPIPPITGDRVQLQQVILNLVTNAFDAMETSEKPRELKIRTREVDNEIILDVMDSGFGIHHDKLETIFEPFFTTKKNGLGLGLSLSRSIVRSHAGRLWADNSSAGRTLFHMALPAAELKPPVFREAGLNAGLQQETDLLPTVYPDAGRKIRILLADDHDIVRKGIANLLSIEPDIEIVGSAADGKEAVESAAKLLPDVILMDISMPKLDGIEATCMIHNQYPQICIIGFSMFEEAGRIQAMRVAGASLYLRKSAPAEELINTIRTGYQACRGMRSASSKGL